MITGHPAGTEHGAGDPKRRQGRTAVAPRPCVTSPPKRIIRRADPDEPKIETEPALRPDDRIGKPAATDRDRQGMPALRLNREYSEIPGPLQIKREMARQPVPGGAGDHTPEAYRKETLDRGFHVTGRQFRASPGFHRQDDNTGRRIAQEGILETMADIGRSA